MERCLSGTGSIYYCSSSFTERYYLRCAIVFRDWSRAEKTLRENTVELYYLYRSPAPFFRRWVTCKQIYRKLDINEHKSELVLGYRFSDWVDRLYKLFDVKYGRFYLPKSWGLFDSWDCYDLDKRPVKNDRLWLDEKEDKKE